MTKSKKTKIIPVNTLYYEEDKCPICLETDWTKKGTVILPCNHKLCLNCYMSLRENSNNCHICRNKLPGEKCIPLRKISTYSLSLNEPDISSLFFESIESNIENYLNRNINDQDDLFQALINLNIDNATKYRLLKNLTHVHIRSFLLKYLRSIFRS